MTSTIVFGTERDQDFATYLIPESEDAIPLLGPVRAVTLLAGANNCGKSRLLRKLFTKTPPTFQGAYLDSVRAIRELLEEVCALPARDGARGITETARVVLTKMDGLGPDFWTWGATAADEVQRTGSVRLSEADGAEAKALASLLGYARRSTNAHNGTLNGLWNKMRHQLHTITTARMEFTPTHKVYIPIQRSLTTLLMSDGERTDSDLFSSTTRHHYKIPQNRRDLDIFTGLDFYERVREARLGPRAEREKFSAFEDFIGKHFFSGRRIDIVARHAQKSSAQHVTVLIGDEGEEREIHNLGDGIAALIILLYPIFMAQADAWILIEEPEVHLHPGFERLFLGTILDDPKIAEKNVRIFMTTHSNHLLGLAAGDPERVSVFSLSSAGISSEKFFVRSIAGRSMQLMHDLGVENGSVLLANCSIWVEGPTDRLILRSYLGAYFRHHEVMYLEDLDFCFFLYGGSLVEHYVFTPEDAQASACDEPPGETEPAKQDYRLDARSLANRVLLVCDMDGSERKTARHEELETSNSDVFKFCSTEPAIEIENTIPKHALQALLPRLHPRKVKSTEWMNDLDDGYLHSTRLGQLCKERGHGFACEKSGTLTSQDKIELAKLLSAHPLTWTQLGDVAQRMTSTIVEFIRKHNPHRN